MDIKKYLLQKHDNICKMTLDAHNSDTFLEGVTDKLISGSNLFIFSFDELSDSSAFSILKRARQLVAEYGALFFIFGRIDFAISLCADGIFLDETHLEINNFKEFLPNNFIVLARIGCDIEADMCIK